MPRHLTTAVGGLALGLIVITLACGAPSRDVAPGSPAAEATNVRRTAVAQVQRIIANPSTPTPQPAATATPGPSCANAIWWTEARAHIGESHTVQGNLVATRPITSGGTLLELGQPYPDPTGLAVVLASGDPHSLIGKTLCVTGRLDLTEGRPTMRVQSPAAITSLAD